MITRFVKTQLIVFTALSLTAFMLIAFVYVKIPSLLGMGRIGVTVQFPQAAGLYPNANVTYRGYTIGKVTDVRIAPHGVNAVLSVDEAHAPPKNSRAEIHSVSAIGEQYVDFVPDPGDGTTLADGDTVPESRTRTPIPTADVLDNAQNLLTAVKPGQVNTVLDEGAQAFRNLGPDLGRLLDSTNKLVDTANANYEPTQQLINDAGPVLDAQQASSPAIRHWASSLNGVTGQLRARDGDLRGLLHNGSQAAGQAGDLLSQLSPTMPTLLNNADVLARLAKDYHAPIEQVLVIYPMFVGASQTLVPDHRQGAFNFNLTTNVNSPNCAFGWVPPGQPGGARDSNQLGDEPLPGTDYCKLPQNDPQQARSARQLQCFEPGSPPGRRAPTIYDCRSREGYRPGTQRGQQIIPGAGGMPGSGTQLPGPLTEPDPLGVVGAPVTAPPPRSEDLTWQKLLLGEIKNPSE